MIHLRPDNERGSTKWSWLESRHTFSFGEYYDPRFCGWGALRFLNEDRIALGMGFGMQPHRDLDILTVVLSGSLLHKDSLGNECVLQSGDMQLLSSGEGVLHSEMNASTEETLHLLEIGIEARHKGLPPNYQIGTFAAENCVGGWCIVASPNQDADAFVIQQDAWIWRTLLAPEGEIRFALASGHSAWLHMVSGSVLLRNHLLKTGDGAGIKDEPEIVLEGREPADVMLIELRS